MRSRPGSSARAVLSAIVAVALSASSVAVAAPPDTARDPAAAAVPATPAVTPSDAPSEPARDVDKPFGVATATMGLGAGLLLAGAASGVVMVLLREEFREQRDESLALRLEVDCTDPTQGLCRRLSVRADAAGRNSAKADALALRLGAGLGATGLVVLLAGVLVFALGTKETRKPKSRRLGVAPQWMPAGGGLALHGRF
jgi:hypothetical protein